MSTTSRLVVSALLAATPSLSLGQSNVTPSPSKASLDADVDALVRADLLSHGVPGVSVVVSRGGETLLQRAWGLANVADGRAAEPSTTYRIGSIAKQFTAALVLELVDRGTLSLGDSIGGTLTGGRPEWDAITVEQLLNHTSGLKGEFRQFDRRTEALTTDALVAMAARDPLAAPPGTTWGYSNTGYMLLGALIEKLYDKPYGAALRAEIAQPLGLTTLAFCDDAEKLHGAAGTLRSADGKVAPIAAIHASQALGSGGICATAGDLAKWNQALHGGRVLSASSYAAMTTPRGAAVSRYYGFGLYIRPAPWGSPAMVHDGQTAGYTGENAWYPAESLSVTVLYNTTPRLPQDVSDVIGQIVVGVTPTPAPEDAAAATPATDVPESLAKFLGEYEMAPGMTLIVHFEDGSLYGGPTGMSKQRLELRSGTTYGAAGSGTDSATLTFVVDASGQVTGAILREDGGERTLRKIE